MPSVKSRPSRGRRFGAPLTLELETRVAIPTTSADALNVRRRRQLASAAREAEGYLELGLHRHALKALTRRGDLVYRDAHACFLWGECLREMARYRDALAPLRRSAALSPEEAETWLALGWCYKRTGRLDLAITSLEHAVAVVPTAAVVHYNLACYYSLANRGLEALRRLKLAFRYDQTLVGLVEAEEDFDRIREDPAFRLLLRAVS